MKKSNKTYNWAALKDQLAEYLPNKSIWESISTSLDTPSPKTEFNQFKDQLSQHMPKSEIWDNISSELESPEPQYDFHQIKGKLKTHEPESKVWDNISNSLDGPSPVFNFTDYKDKLAEYSPNENLWDDIESGLEISKGLDQLPSHNPPENIWSQIEGELEEVKGGISFIRTVILFGLSMLFIIGAAIMVNQGGANKVETQKLIVPATEAEPMMFASNELIKVEWNDDEDVRLIREMCQDYMAVCEQPAFKKLENELHELNGHKQELLELVSDFDEESSYGPMLAKIENQKTALMKEMISMI